MELFKKLRKGMSVLLVACMIAGMMVTTPVMPVYAQESSGSSSSDKVNILTDQSNDEQGSGSESDAKTEDTINTLTKIDLFKNTIPVASKLTVGGYDAHVITYDKYHSGFFNLSLAIKHNLTVSGEMTWDNTVATVGNEAQYKTGIFKNPEANSVSTLDESAGYEDVKFNNASNQMLSVSDVIKEDGTLNALGYALEAPYWLSSEVVSTNEKKKYSVAAYVKAEEKEVDITDKGNIFSNVYVKAVTADNKVKYIYASDAMNVTEGSEWIYAQSSASLSNEGNTEYAALYNAIQDGTEAMKLEESLVVKLSERVYNLVAGTTVNVTRPAGTDKVIVAMMNSAKEVVAYKVLEAELDNATSVAVTLPEEVGSGYLKLIAFSAEDGAIKGEGEYQINVAAKQELEVTIKGAVDGKLTLPLKFEDSASVSPKAEAGATINLTVKESNYYTNPSSAEEFVLSKVENANEVEANKVTSVQISEYKDSTLTVSSTTNFTEDEMKAYAGEKNVYLYCKNSNTDKYVLVGKIDIARQYTSTFAYDNNNSNSVYTYGDIYSTIPDTTHVNENLSMSLVNGSLKGVNDYLASVGLSQETNVTADELVYLSRLQVDAAENKTQFNYVKLGAEEGSRVNTSINVGTYRTESKPVVASVTVTGEDAKLTACADDAATADNEVFRFLIECAKDGERTFEIVPKVITLATKNQIVNDKVAGQGPSSDPAFVEITGVDSNTLPYGDTLEVNLTKDDSNNIVFSKISGSPAKYKITNSASVDATYNYDVNFSETQGKFITTSLKAQLTADGDKALVQNENGVPTYAVTYDGVAHSVVVTPGTITDADGAEFEQLTGATITYKYNGVDSEVAPKFKEAGTYLVEYTVAYTDTTNNNTKPYEDYTRSYYVVIEKRPVTVTIANQTYQYTNEKDTSYFKQFNTDENKNLVKPEAGTTAEEGLLTGHEITGIVLEPKLDVAGAFTGDGIVTADKDTVAIKSGDTPVTNNYAITINPGVLKVEKAKITVKISDVEGEYDGSEHLLSSNISATYGVDTNSAINERLVNVYYYSTNERVDDPLTLDKKEFKTELPDLTSAGERTVYYYATATGYGDSEIDSFNVNITKRTLTITLKDQNVKYPNTIVKEFTEKLTNYATVDGLLSDHTVKGTINAVSSDRNYGDDIYDKGTLNLGPVTVLDGNGIAVTVNYNISAILAGYTITKNSFNDEQVEVVPYSGTYDSEEHPAVEVKPAENVFDSTKGDKKYYCLFNKEEFDENTYNNSIKDTAENVGDKVWSDTVPTVKNAGTYVVAYKIVKDGYMDYINYANVTIEQAALKLYVSSQNTTVNNIVLQAEGEKCYDYVTPHTGNLKGNDKITAVKFYSEDFDKSKDGVVTGVDIDVKKDNGEYAVVVMDGNEAVTPNYNITTVSGILTVTTEKLNVVVNPITITYDAQDHSILELLTINGKPAKEAIAADTTINITVSTNGVTYEAPDKLVVKTPGTLKLYYKISAKGYDDYRSDGTVDLKVTKRPLNIAIKDQTIVYGGEIKQDGYTIEDLDTAKNTGLLKGHKLNTDNFKLELKPFADGVVTGTTDITHKGQITITTEDGEEDVTGCYELTPTRDATCTVTPAEFTAEMLEVNVDNAVEATFGTLENVPEVTETYKADNYNVTIALTEAYKDLDGYKVTYSIDGTASKTLELINAGTYNVNATVSATGYESKTVSFKVIINKAQINIQLAEQTITYGEVILQPSNTPYKNTEISDGVVDSIKGIMGNDTIIIGTLTRDGDSIKLSAENVTVKYANSGCYDYINYDIKATDANLTEKRLDITIKPADQKIKDDQKAVTNVAKNNASQYISLIDSSLREDDFIDSASIVVGVTDTDENKYTKKYDLSIGSVVIKNSNGDDVTEKYNIVKNEGSLFVESMPVVISEITEFGYDGKEHKPNVTVDTGFESDFDLNSASISYSTTVTDVTGEGGTDVTVTVSAEGYKSKIKTVKVKVTKKPILIEALDQGNLNLEAAITQPEDDNYKGVVQVTGLAEGHKVKGIKLQANTTKSGKQTISVVTDGIDIVDEAGNSKAENYDIKYGTGSVYVIPKAITIYIGGEKAGNVKNLTHKYDGKSPLEAITVDPAGATLNITVDGEKVGSLEDAKKATVDAGEYTVTIKATMENHVAAQTTLIIVIDKAEAIEVETAGVNVYENGTLSGTTEKYTVPYNANTSYGLALSVTSCGKAAVASEYSIEYAESEDGPYSETLRLSGVGNHTVYYRVRVNTDNYANEKAVITGSQVITICDHTDSQFTLVAGTVYECNDCGGRIQYKGYTVSTQFVVSDENGKISCDKWEAMETIENKKYGPNETVVANATTKKEGTYVFLGWYLKAALEGTLNVNELTYSIVGLDAAWPSLRWEYKAGLDMSGASGEYVAVFKENIKKVKLTAVVKPDTDETTGGNVTITVGDATEEAGTTVTKSDIVLGSDVTVTATADNTHKFAYWTNESGIVLSTDAAYKFSVTSDTTVKAVFIKKSEVTVNTYNKYGQSIKTESFTAGEEDVVATIIDAPVVLDYVFTGWKLELVKTEGTTTIGEYKLLETEDSQAVDGGEYANVDEMKAALKKEIASIVKDSAAEGCEVKLTALYQEAKKKDFTVTVVGGTITNSGGGEITEIENGQSTVLTVKTAITVQANPAPEKQKFEGWRNKAGDIVSYNEVYSFYASEDITVTASYVNDDEIVEVKATTDMTKIAIISKAATSNKFSFTSTATVPEGCTIEKVGLRLWKKSSVTAVGDLGECTLEKGLSSTATTCNYTYSVSIGNTTDCVLYLQSFVDYVDENGKRYTEPGKYYQVEMKAGATEMGEPVVVK